MTLGVFSMKKVFLVLLIVLVLLIGTLNLVACKDDEEEISLPTTKYEKVQFAFNGVEKSFKTVSSASNVNASMPFSISEAASTTTDSALNTIDSIYKSTDSLGDVIKGLKYDTPPMMQFQYLKAALNRIGSGYSFGTKYYYDVTGTMYADFATGTKKTSDDGDNYKYNYSFNLGMAINIDDNDLITADVSFYIRLTKGTETTITTTWYVKMILNYDMTKVTPNYTLDMYTDEDEVDLPTRNCYTVENDYVEVSNGSVKEWRQFVLETDTKLVKDASHPTFDSYINEGITYTIGNTKWYKNSDLRKAHQLTSAERATFANAFYSLGMNSTDINGASFISKKGTESNVISTLYNEFSSLLGKDIIYSIIVTDEDHSQNDDFENAGIAVKEGAKEYNFADGNWICADTKVGGLLTATNVWKDYSRSRYIVPLIYYIDKDGRTTEPVDNLDDIQIYVETDTATILLDKNAYFTDEYISKNLPNQFKIKLVLGEFSTYMGANVRVFEQSIPAIITANQDPNAAIVEELVSLGFPEYDETSDYVATKERNKYYITHISNTNIYNYCYNKFYDAGFVSVDREGVLFRKLSSNKILEVKAVFSDTEGGDTLVYSIYDNDNYYSYNWDGDFINEELDNKISIPAPEGTHAMYNIIEGFNENPSLVFIYGLTDDEVNAYLDMLSSQENTYLIEYEDNMGVLRYVNNDDDMIYEIFYLAEYLEQDGERYYYPELAFRLSTSSRTNYHFTVSKNSGDAETIENIDYSNYYAIRSICQVKLQVGETLTFDIEGDYNINSIEYSGTASAYYDVLEGTKKITAKSNGTFIVKLNYIENRALNESNVNAIVEFIPEV